MKFHHNSPLMPSLFLKSFSDFLILRPCLLNWFLKQTFWENGETAPILLQFQSNPSRFFLHELMMDKICPSIEVCQGKSNGPKVQWSQSPMVPKSHCHKVPWSQSPMVPKPQGPKVPRSQTSHCPLVTKSHCCMVPTFHGPKVPWSKSPMVPESQGPRVPWAYGP